MQYYVSLPEGWTPQRTWPILVTVTGGLKNFQQNAELFATARDKRPYILITLVNLTNGGQSTLRQAPEYHYSAGVWDAVDQTGWCRFDLEGLDAVLADVKGAYHGEDKYYITGHSAGGHLVWLAVFMRPDALAGAVTTGGNFRRRCLEDSILVGAPRGSPMPIRGYVGDQDDQRNGLSVQFGEAGALAASRGFTHVALRVVAHEGHNPMPTRVFAYLDSLRSAP
jgi:dienelactone hydrolase